MSHLEDKLAILEAHHTYLLAVDSHEVQPFVDHFAPDGVYTSPFGEAIGAEAIAQTIRHWHEGGVTHGKRHMIGPVSVQISSETRATATSSYFVVEAEHSPGIVASGGYTDEWRKLDGRWVIARRVQTVDPSFKF